MGTQNIGRRGNFPHEGQPRRPLLFVLGGGIWLGPIDGKPENPHGLRVGLTRTFDMRNPDHVRAVFSSLTDAEIAEFVRESTELSTETRANFTVTHVDHENRTVTLG